MESLTVTSDRHWNPTMPASYASLHHDATVPSSPNLPSVTNPTRDAHERQGTLPVGPTGVVHRGAEPSRSARTAAQVESNSAFLSDAGRVEFGRYEATLRDIWMAFAYFASLSDARECYAELENVGKRARRSGRTVRRHVPALMARGLVQCSARQGGHTPSRWSVVLPADVRAGRTSVSLSVRGGQDVRAGRTGCPGRADTVSDNIRDRGKREKRTSSSRAREVCPICKKTWPAKFGPDCHKCGYTPSTWKTADEPTADDTPTDEPKACTCGDAYRQSYNRRCVDCDGEPSPDQRDALREKHGGGGAHEGGGV